MSGFIFNWMRNPARNVSKGHSGSHLLSAFSSILFEKLLILTRYSEFLLQALPQRNTRSVAYKLKLVYDILFCGFGHYREKTHIACTHCTEKSGNKHL